MEVWLHLMSLTEAVKKSNGFALKDTYTPQRYYIGQTVEQIALYVILDGIHHLLNKLYIITLKRFFQMRQIIIKKSLLTAWNLIFTFLILNLASNMMVYIGIKRPLHMNEKRESMTHVGKTESSFFAYEKEKKIISIQQQITVFLCLMAKAIQTH